MTQSHQSRKEPLRHPTPAEIRAARYANRPPAPQVVFIQPSLRQEGAESLQSIENRRYPKIKTEGLRMTKPATEAARRSNLTESHIRAVLESPTDVEPDRDNPDRTRFTKGSLIVVTGKDGVIIGIYKR